MRSSRLILWRRAKGAGRTNDRDPGVMIFANLDDAFSRSPAGSALPLDAPSRGDAHRPRHADQERSAGARRLQRGGLARGSAPVGGRGGARFHEEREETLYPSGGRRVASGSRRFSQRRSDLSQRLLRLGGQPFRPRPLPCWRVEGEEVRGVGARAGLLQHPSPDGGLRHGRRLGFRRRDGGGRLLSLRRSSRRASTFEALARRGGGDGGGRGVRAAAPGDERGPASGHIRLQASASQEQVRQGLRTAVPGR